MKRMLMIGLLIILPCALYGQRDLMPLNSQYLFNGLLINPAYAGSHDVLSFAGTFRKQWLGFDGAPVDYSSGFHWPMAKSKLGMGLVLRQEIVLNQRTSEIGLDYAFRFIVGKGKMSFGLRTALNLFQEDPFKGDVRDPTDPLFTQNRLQGSAMMPNFGFGMFYFTERIYAGFSIPWFFTLPSGSSLSSFFTGESNMSHYNYLLTGGYYLKITARFWFKPTFLLKYQPVSGFQYDVNGSFVLFDDCLWVGGGYRGDGTVIAMLDLQMLRQLKLGFSWDYPTGVIRQATAGSMEFSVRYNFNFKVNAVSPRFF